MNPKISTIALTGALFAASTGLAFAQTSNSQTDWRQQGYKATHALNMLEDHGDGQFSNFAASGENFTADVMKDGRTMHVLINPETSQIQQIG